jgi:serine/threonine-protein kinase
MPTQADLRFAQAAVSAGYLSKEKAQELLHAQKQAEDISGTKADFRKVALNGKALTPEQVKSLEESLGLGAQPKIKQFGPYLVQKKIGQGGMGAVFLATDTRVNVPVALKVLSSGLASNPDYLKRFQREAAVAAAIKHPNVVACYGIGQEQNIHYMALEYVDGGDVMGLIKQGPVTEARGLEIARQVAEALVAAHAAGIVHRDIKPPNILLMKDGTAKLGDLGLARAEEDHSVTQTGIAIGTPHYMSPEQADGEKDLDIRADIYSFGATLYHIVCGKPPFEGAKAVVVLSKHVHEQIASPKETVPELSDGICHIIEKCMAKAKEDRYQTPAALVEDIRRVQQGLSPATEVLALGTSTVRQRALAKTVADRKERRKAGGAPGQRKSSVSVMVGVAAALVLGAVGVWLVRGSGTGGKEPDKSGRTAHSATNQVGSARSGVSSSSVKPLPTKEVAGETEKPPAEAGTTNKEEAGIAGMFREAEKYAQEHPEDFREVVGRFETVQKRGERTEYEFKAKDQAKSWRTKWEDAAKAEFEKRQQAAESHLQAGRFEEAGKLWNEFPEALATETFKKRVEEEQTKLAELTKSLADQLSAQAAPLLAKEAETLTEAEIKALTGILDRAKAPPAGLEERQKEVLASLLKKVEACLEAYRSAKAAEWARQFDAFWDKFSKLVKDRKLEEAEALIAANPSLVVPPSGGSGEHPEPPEGGTTNKLKEDVRLLKDLFSRAEANLGQLIGKTIRVAGFGTAMTVTEVQDGKLVVTQAGAKVTVGPEKLEPEELLKLGLAAAEDAKAASHQEFLFQFFFGRSAKAKTTLARAKAQGVELAFYEERLEELEQGQEKARAEKEAVALVSQIESAIKAEKVEMAESKLQKLEKDFGETQAAKASLPKLRESLTEAQSRAAARKNLVFIPAGKFLYGEGANQQEIDLPAFYIAKYETTNAEYDEFKAWWKKEVEKAEKGDPHRYCYPGYLPDGKELTEEQLKTLEKMTPEKRVAAVAKMGLKGGEAGGKSHEYQKYGGDCDKPNHPVVGLDWYDAWAYCRWRGGRLPTEQEWEKAASWDPKLKRKRVYPWGDEFVPKFCNGNSPEDGFAQTCPVNEFPKGVSAYGCCNMAGNVWEWCDWWVDKSGGARVLRGGSWSSDSTASFRCAYRLGLDPTIRNALCGFRCARTY